MPEMNVQERIARQYLAEKRFRKARDEFKLLCKLDRPKYLPLLVESNIGLLREMLGKGMAGEAQQLLVYLKTIASPQQIALLEIELNAPPDSSVPNEGVTAILELLSKTHDKTEQVRLADRAVLFFSPVGDSNAQAATELEAIISALKSVSEKNYEQASECVRPVGQNSCFSHWKLFVKGLVAFHCGQTEKAARFLSELPQASAPAKAAQAYLLLLGKIACNNNQPLPSEPCVEAACRMVGEPGCGAVLLRAEQSWRKDKPAQGYRDLRVGLRHFPSESTDLIGLLSEFGVNCFFSMGDDAKHDFIRLVYHLIEERRAKSPLERMLFLRLLVLDATQEIPDDTALEEMENFLGIRRRVHGEDRAVDSLAYEWLGNVMSANDEPISPFGFIIHQRTQRMRNSRLAQELLEKAIALDPGNLSASLKLCEVYGANQQGSDRNRLLDRMSSQFPDEKQVLLLAGQGCLERKAFKKGIDYLEKALSIDQLDPSIPDQLVYARLLHARDYFQKKRPEDARQLFAKIEESEIQSFANLTRSRWCLKIQQGIIEQAWGDEEKGRLLLDEGRQASPSLAVFLFFSSVIERLLANRKPCAARFLNDFKNLKKSEANVAEACVLARIYIHATKINSTEAENFTYPLNDYLLNASSQPFEREDALAVMEFCRRDSYFQDAGRKLVEARLKHDSLDPAFRLFGVWFGMFDFEEQRQELLEIIDEAQERKDDQTARRARQALDSLKPPMPFPWEEEDFDEPDPVTPDYNNPDQIESALDALPPETLKLYEKLLTLLGNASDAEIREFKRTRPREMPEEIFDLLVDFSRRKSKGPRSKSDPYQPDLFG